MSLPAIIYHADLLHFVIAGTPANRMLSCWNDFVITEFAAIVTLLPKNFPVVILPPVLKNNPSPMTFPFAVIHVEVCNTA